MNRELQAENKIQKISYRIREKGYKLSQIKKNNYNYEISVTNEKQKLKVLVYFGKKGLKTVVQGNTDSKFYKEIYSIVSDNYQIEFNEEPDIFYSEYIGTDETGKGDYFGPLVVSAMFVNENTQVFLENLGVKDSKELSDKQINIIATKIRKEFPHNFNIVIISPQKYNQLYENFKNINKLLDWAHSKSIENLLKIFNCKTVITDQFSKKKLTISNNTKYNSINFIQTPKAEKYIGVAAASILARNTMNNWFHKKELEGYYLTKGASSKVIANAKDIIQKYGKEKLSCLAKLHFKTTNQVLNSIIKEP